MKIKAFILSFVLLTIATTITVQATGYGTTSYGSPCQPSYGGYGQSPCSSIKISLDKTVKNPQTGTFVNNLGPNDPKYFADQTVLFRITVTNTGNEVITNTVVKDTFPQYISFVSGNGSFDKNSSVFTFTVDKLNPGEAKSFDVTTKVVSESNLPGSTGVTCLINQVASTVNNQTVNDNSQFCVEKKVLSAVPTSKGGVTIYPSVLAANTPATGAEAFSFLALVPTALAGFALRRRSK